MTQFRLCGSLREVADHQYFYEALVHFSRQPIPYGKHYESWKRRKGMKLSKSGEDLRFLGARIKRA
jgi:hypothetical protein